MSFLIQLISFVTWAFTLLIFAQVVLSFLVSPYHPVRERIDRLIDPLLKPIRRFLPPMAGFDFSPMILILLVQVVEQLLIRLLISF